VEEVARPVPGPAQVLVEVRAAGIQPGEVHIRTGELHERWPAMFPSGQGSDLAGVVAEVGPQVRGVAVGDEVLGFTHSRASHAEFVVVDDVALTSRPVGLPWDVAGSLYVAGTTAYATVFAVDPGPADTFGDGYVQLAVELGVRPERINTIRDWQAAAEIGARTYGEGSAACAVVLGELARLAARGELEVQIARTYSLEQVRDAFRELERRHTHGKIVLRP
jgi:NADPH:quinone reductase-like Zn-dependent oxidoreductase